jgi:hypothetical protein
MWAVATLAIAILRSVLALFRSRQDQAIVELALRQQLLPVVRDELLERPPQVVFAQKHYVIEQLPANSADESLRPSRSATDSETPCAGDGDRDSRSTDRGTEDRVIVVDQESMGRGFGKGSMELLAHPLSSWPRGDVEGARRNRRTVADYEEFFEASGKEP